MSVSNTVVVHADESCLANGQARATPGGAASLIETNNGSGIVRRDFWIAAPDTTNNRMALCGAIATFALLGSTPQPVRTIYISDSEYLVKGMREWVPQWRSRNWRRKGGVVQNLDLWKALVDRSGGYEVIWQWVRGHAGNPKNEYVNDLAMRAAATQESSQGVVASGFERWLERHRQRGHFSNYDPDAAFLEIAARPTVET